MLLRLQRAFLYSIVANINMQHLMFLSYQKREINERSEDSQQLAVAKIDSKRSGKERGQYVPLIRSDVTSVYCKRLQQHCISLKKMRNICINILNFSFVIVKNKEICKGKCMRCLLIVQFKRNSENMKVRVIW